MKKTRTDKTQTQCKLTRKRQSLRTKTNTTLKSEQSVQSLNETAGNENAQNCSDVEDVTRKARKKYQCEVCQKEFGYSNDLRKHLRIHLDERPFSCTQCDKTFRQAGCLKNHIACQHGTDISYTCDYCLKTFPIKERLRLHLRIHSGFKPYHCFICMKKFARGGQVTQHMVSHANSKKVGCSKCPATFTNSANLRSHLKAHYGIKDCCCEICGKTFLRIDALKKHINSYHKNVKSFTCGICKRSFKGHLTQHLQTHEQHKIYACTVCNATFAQNSQLKVHSRVHSGERPFRCMVCLKSFGHSSVLRLHVRKHTGEKPFSCPICNESTFSQLPHLKTHMRAIHNKLESYLCRTCNTFFRTKIELQQHNDMKHRSLEDEDPENSYDSHGQYLDTTTAARALTRIRLLVAVLLKRISTPQRLKQLGFEKRLIDNVLISALKTSGQPCCEGDQTDTEKLRANVSHFLKWTVPEKLMKDYERQRKSVDEVLEELAMKNNNGK